MTGPAHEPAHARYWRVSRDGDPAALRLYLRHYSCRHYRDGRTRKLFVGPGEKLVLLTRNADALFAWRKFRSRDGQHGVNAAVFRNEGLIQSSLLIRDAMSIAWRRWPGARLYTYVNAAHLRSTNPGYCFRKADGRKCGTTKGGLLVLEALP